MLERASRYLADWRKIVELEASVLYSKASQMVLIIFQMRGLI